jgi:hypothetical protein
MTVKLHSNDEYKAQLAAASVLFAGKDYAEAFAMGVLFRVRTMAQDTLTEALKALAEGDTRVARALIEEAQRDLNIIPKFGAQS